VQLEDATPTERVVTELWAKLLARPAERIPRHTNFFDFGANSLLLVALANEIRAQLQHTVPLALLFQKTTVHTLAAYLDDQQAADTAEAPSTERDSRLAALARQRQARARAREPRDDS
jgi:hypothetical protein